MRRHGDAGYPQLESFVYPVRREKVGSGSLYYNQRVRTLGVVLPGPVIL